MWFNRRHERVGPLLQGRYKGVLVEGEGSWAWVASVYVHLNPVRIKALGLDKKERKAASAGLGRKASREELRGRLKKLRGYRWSSYRAYAGYAEAPEWLRTEDLWKRSEGRKSHAPESYRRYVEEYLKPGEAEGFWMTAKADGALGTEAFMKKMRKLAKGDRREQKELRRQEEHSFDEVVKAVERAQGETLERFREKRGDWGRDVILLVASGKSGLTLRELGSRIGGMDYLAVRIAIQRMKKRLTADPAARSLVASAERILYSV